MDDFDEKQNQLVASGYLTNFSIVVTNCPSTATNQQLKSAEISRRLQADKQIDQDEVFSWSGPDDDQQITVTCRPSFVSRYIQTIKQP